MNPGRFLRRTGVRTEALLCLALARALVRFVPFKLWRSSLGPLDSEAAAGLVVLPDHERDRAASIGRIVCAMAARAWFDAVCLPQAMAARWMLRRRGIASRIVVGSRRGDLDEGTLFHAWLVASGVIVTGASERAAFMDFRSRARETERGSA